MISRLPRYLLSRRIYLLLVVHACLAAACYWLAFQLRFDFRVEPRYAAVFRLSVLWVVAVKLAAFYQFGSFHGWWRHVTFEDLTALLRVATVSTVTIVSIDYFLIPQYQIPRSVLALDWGCMVLLFGGLRSAWRLGREGFWTLFIDDDRSPALLVGADRAGIALARQINTNRDLDYRIVGFLDENESHHHSRLGGIPVVGGPKDVAALADKYDATHIFVVTENTFGGRLRHLAKACRKAKIRLQVIPPVTELLNGSDRLKIRDINIEDLLRREPVRLDDGAIRSMLKGRCVLVTGAGGSIGSEMCRQIVRSRPARLIMVDHAENSLFYVEQELSKVCGATELSACVVDIRDEVRLESIFRRHRPEIIFHAAAHKHVPMMENNPGEAIVNNVLGTRLLADMADAYGVERFVFISTDKAVRPSSVMGASKHLAERFVSAFSEESPTTFVVVRFGNVLASAGSVVPIFQEQIRQGGPITVTHPEMTRYFMTIPEASQLVLQAAAIGSGGEIFVLDMGEPLRILDLARDLILLSGLCEGDIEITFVGPRPGEKLFEEILLSDEETLPTTHPKVRVARSRYYTSQEVRESISQIAELVYADDSVLRARLAELVSEYKPTDVCGSPDESVASSE